MFGRGRLWVGVWWQNPQWLGQASSKDGGDSKYPYGYKYPTWTVVNDHVTDSGGAPQISVKALDGHGHDTSSTGGYASSTTPDDPWWPTVVGFSPPGCWQIKETVGGDSITYVVKI